VVDPDITGFIVDSVEQGVEAVSKAQDLDRYRIREKAEERWTKERMVKDYIHVYEKILSL
jgi:hypothetical protein